MLVWFRWLVWLHNLHWLFNGHFLYSPWLKRKKTNQTNECLEQHCQHHFPPSSSRLEGNSSQWKQNRKKNTENIEEFVEERKYFFLSFYSSEKPEDTNCASTKITLYWWKTKSQVCSTIGPIRGRGPAERTFFFSCLSIM